MSIVGGGLSRPVLSRRGTRRIPGTDIETCLTAITASADVVASCLACAWLPGEVGTPPARMAIARLAGALGTRLTWPANSTASS